MQLTRCPHRDGGYVHPARPHREGAEHGTNGGFVTHLVPWLSAEYAAMGGDGNADATPPWPVPGRGSSYRLHVGWRGMPTNRACRFDPGLQHQKDYAERSFCDDH